MISFFPNDIAGSLALFHNDPMFADDVRRTGGVRSECHVFHDFEFKFMLALSLQYDIPQKIATKHPNVIITSSFAVSNM